MGSVASHRTRFIIGNPSFPTMPNWHMQLVVSKNSALSSSISGSFQLLAMAGFSAIKHVHLVDVGLERCPSPNGWRVVLLLVEHWIAKWTKGYKGTPPLQALRSTCQASSSANVLLHDVEGQHRTWCQWVAALIISPHPLTAWMLIIELLPKISTMSCRKCRLGQRDDAARWAITNSSSKMLCSSCGRRRLWGAGARCEESE